MISACYILRDSGNTIMRSLNSLLISELISEVICVIDTRSNDDTEKLIKIWADTNNHIRVTVKHYEWVSDSFADARNYGISLATEPYWMFVDGDEELVSISKPECDFYTGDVINTYKKAGDITHYSVRLCRNGIGIKYEFARHENVERSLNGLEQGYMNLVIRHIGYQDLSPEQLKAKTASLLERHLKQLTEEPDNVALKYHIFNCYRTLGHTNKAISYGYECLFTPINNGLKAQACIRLYEIYKGFNTEEYKLMAIEQLYRSLNLCPNQFSAKIILMEEMQNEAQKQALKKEILTMEYSEMPMDISKSKVMELLNEKS